MIERTDDHLDTMPAATRAAIDPSVHTLVAYRMSDVGANPFVRFGSEEAPTEVLGMFRSGNRDAAAGGTRRLLAEWSSCPAVMKELVVGVAVDVGYYVLFDSDPLPR